MSNQKKNDWKHKLSGYGLSSNNERKHNLLDSATSLSVLLLSSVPLLK